MLIKIMAQSSLHGTKEPLMRPARTAYSCSPPGPRAAVTPSAIDSTTPLLYAAKTGPDLNDLFKPVIGLSGPAFTANRSFSFSADGIVPGKTNYFQLTTNLSATNPAAWQT